MATDRRERMSFLLLPRILKLLRLSMVIFFFSRAFSRFLFFLLFSFLGDLFPFED